MRCCGVGVAGLLALIAGWITVGNVPPTMEDHYVTTVQDAPVAFELRAQDEDIDPNDPEAHPLRFALVEGPGHGVLIGDMGKVTYEGPHDAVIVLTYVPATGFVGTDVVTVAVYDPYDATAKGTVTIEIDVTARRVVGLLAGNWTLGATYLPESGSISAFQMQLTEVYRVGLLTMKGIAGWTMRSVGGVKKVTLNALRLNGDVRLSRMTVSTTLALDPDAASPSELFESWRTTASFALQGVSFRHTAYLAGDVPSSYQSLYAQGNVGGLSIGNTLRFDVNEACVFAFGRNDAVLSWRWCELRMYATLGMTCDGFQQLVLTANDLPLASALLSGLSLDTKLTYTLGAKALSTTLEWRPGRVGCIRTYGELVASGLEIEGVSIYGLRIEGNVNGVRVVSATSFDETRNSSVTGQSDCFEMLWASGTLTGCCGTTGTWRTATYFSATSSALLGWGMTTMSVNAGLTENISGWLAMVFRSGEFDDPKLELAFGWTVRW